MCAGSGAQRSAFTIACSLSEYCSAREVFQGDAQMIGLPPIGLPPCSLEAAQEAADALGDIAARGGVFSRSGVLSYGEDWPIRLLGEEAMWHREKSLASPINLPNPCLSAAIPSSQKGSRLAGSLEEGTMATRKSASRKPGAKKAAKRRKSPAAAGKAARTGKLRVARKKAAAPRKRRAAAKKAPVTCKAKAPAATKAPEALPVTAEIDDRMAIVRNNLRELVEQAASSSGASDEELMSQRITEQEAKLELLKTQREALLQRASTAR